MFAFLFTILQCTLYNERTKYLLLFCACSCVYWNFLFALNQTWNNNCKFNYQKWMNAAVECWKKTNTIHLLPCNTQVSSLEAAKGTKLRCSCSSIWYCIFVMRIWYNKYLSTNPTKFYSECMLCMYYHSTCYQNIMSAAALSLRRASIRRKTAIISRRQYMH